jgi:transposase
VEPEQLNDDKLARMLDAVAEKAEALKTAICFAAIDEFGLDVGRLHWDLTSLEFAGSFENQDEEWATLTYGYHPAGVGKHVQVRVGNLVCGDGAIGGLMHKTYSGNASDQNSVMDHLHLFRKMAERYGKVPRLVGDSKLVSPEMMVKFEEAGLQFICPEPSSQQLKDVFRELVDNENDQTWEPLNYLSERDKRQKSKPNPIFKGHELSFSVEIQEEDGESYIGGRALARKKMGARGGRPPKPRRVYHFRRLVLFSSSNKLAQQKNRQRYLNRFEKKLKELNVKFQSSWWLNKSESQAQSRVKKLLKSSKVGHFYETELSRSERGWVVKWSKNSKVLAEAEKLDGLYTIVTNVPDSQATMEEIFLDYKRQNDSERRFADWKGPLQVRPLFLKSNQRIIGLIFVLAIALLIFSLIEREVRRNLPDGKMLGLLPVNRPVRATGRNILQALESIQMVALRISGQLHWQTAPLNEVQAQLFKFIGADSRLFRARDGP